MAHGKTKRSWEQPHRAIVEKIGEELRECLELPRELPDRLLTALKQLNELSDQHAETDS